MKDWLDTINTQLMIEIQHKVTAERAQYNILPSRENVFKALQLTPFENIKVVILGQDPYPTAEHATGLAFSVAPTTPLPLSLSNIFKELKNDLGITRVNGDLTDWAKQGVFLLNTALTVREGQKNSHSKLGWDKFTDDVIRQISTKKENVVFILWGNSAAKKAKLIDPTKHLVLTSAHPSPLSANRGFFGSKPFSKTNSHLISCDISPIMW